jgi:tetratricopeptide (TPR) repeat protein
MTPGILALVACAAHQSASTDPSAATASERAVQVAPANRFGPTAVTVSVDGPPMATFDLWRAQPGAEKIYVAADPGDGKERLFLLDTGAAISVLSRDVAEELGLTVEDSGQFIVGLGGQTAWEKATIPDLRLGAFHVQGVDVAVDVKGVPDVAGLAPIAGILGNNVWGHFVLGIDYPADTLELALPGAIDVPRYAEPVVFDGEHFTAAAVLVAESGKQRVRQTVLLEVDTGARGVIIDGVFGDGLESVATEGEEPIFGVGMDDLPPQNFLQSTRRVPLVAIDVGGRTVKKDLSATWINYEHGARKIGPLGMPGLLGHQALADYRVILDFPGQRMALTQSQREPRQNDMHVRYLHELEGATDEQSMLERVDVLAFLDRLPEARAALTAFEQDHPGSPQAALVDARLCRREGNADRALQLVTGLDAATLLQEDELIGAVNGLWLAGRTAEALSLAETATQTEPDAVSGWVALSDARRASGDLAGAREALREANRLDENPDGHLLRRAWIAREEGDRFAAITFARHAMHLLPMDGRAAWFYAMEVAGTPEEGMFRNDLGRALARLHPSDRPFDFLSAAYAELGETAEAASFMALGRDHDCKLAENAMSEKNCEAWYLALSHQDLPEARKQIDIAVAAEPNRPEYLDTLAVVLDAQGNVADARAAAFRAASLAPDNVYLLWQAARMDDEMRATGVEASRSR